MKKLTRSIEEKTNWCLLATNYNTCLKKGSWKKKLPQVLVEHTTSLINYKVNIIVKIGVIIWVRYRNLDSRSCDLFQMLCNTCTKHKSFILKRTQKTCIENYRQELKIIIIIIHKNLGSKSSLEAIIIYFFELQHLPPPCKIQITKKFPS